MSFQTNRAALERAHCIEAPKSGFSINKCVLKSISRDRISADGQGTLNRTMTSLFLHFEVFYKFSNNEYRRFMFDLWQDICAFFGGSKGNPLLERNLPKFLPFTNVNHSCPYQPGLYFIKFSNISANAFAPMQFLPSGRYRLHLSVYDSFKGTRMGTLKVYASISDHRIEQF